MQTVKLTDTCLGKRTRPRKLEEDVKAAWGKCDPSIHITRGNAYENTKVQKPHTSCEGISIREPCQDEGEYLDNRISIESSLTVRRQMPRQQNLTHVSESLA
ncbi:hypothetical protein Fot_56058 [Forsythia ovata]|uniref:Uncharacterized protein n=1 Tax=Forsythia ovata TaxID=205694 RepID=A0ABD1P1U5_9LAMI